jgi:hypothetical protein
LLLSIVEDHFGRRFTHFDLALTFCNPAVSAFVIGFPITLVLAWAFELTPEGIKRTEDVDPATRVILISTFYW